MQWYQIYAKENKSAEILLYEQIGKGWDDSGVGAKKFIEDLNALDVKNINLHINSPGGNVFEGNAIYNALKAHKATINVKIDGIAASIASVVAMSGDTIEMPENAMMMIHDPSGLVVGTAADMEKMAAALKKIGTGLVAVYHNKSNMEKDEISTMMKNETWMTAQEAVEMGFADKVLESVNAQANLEALKQYKYKNVPAQLLTAVSARGKETEKEKIMTQSETPGNQRFEQIVQGYTAQGLSTGNAIRRAVSENPDAHQDYLDRVNDNHAQKLPAKTSVPFKKFEDAVSHFISQNQVTAAAAVKTAVEKYPELHSEYVRRLKQGEKGELC